MIAQLRIKFARVVLIPDSDALYELKQNPTCRQSRMHDGELDGVREFAIAHIDLLSELQISGVAKETYMCSFAPPTILSRAPLANLSEGVWELLAAANKHIKKEINYRRNLTLNKPTIVTWKWIGKDFIQLERFVNLYQKEYPTAETALSGFCSRCDRQLLSAYHLLISDVIAKAVGMDRECGCNLKTIKYNRRPFPIL